MTDLSEVRIETQRLSLVPLSMDYADAIFVEFSDEVTALMYPRPPEKIAETREFISAMVDLVENGEHLPCAILDKATGQFLGCAGLHDLTSDRPEIGVWLKISAHGNHLGYEAVSGLVEWARQNLTCKSLRYPVDERLGGTITGQSVETSLSGRELRLVEYEIPLAKAG
jgi:ribosomal-protein-alanine N-acetyltransferase